MSDLRDDLFSNDEETSPDYDDIFGGDDSRGTVIGRRGASASASPSGSKFLGMTAGERALLSVLIFFCVLILGIAILLITGRIAF